MQRLLDIVVPHYNEDWSVVKPFFDVIAAQRGVDFNRFKIWLVHNGGSDYFPSRYFEDNPAHIEQVKTWRKGVSVARNLGMSYADAKWICFCDCDDCYSTVFALMYVFNVLDNPATDGFNLIWSPFYMHLKDQLTVADKPNSVFMHNKYYRLSWLREHNLRFPEHLYMSEDSAFNTVLMMEMDKKQIGQINTKEPFYVWCRRPGSVTMDLSRWIANAEGHFERNLYILEEYRKRNFKGTERLVGRTITDLYSMLTRQGMEGNKGPILARASEFYNRHILEYRSVSKEDLQIALDSSDRDCCVTEEDKELRPSLDEWIRVNLE